MNEAEWIATFEEWGEAKVEQFVEDLGSDDYDDDGEGVDFAAVWLARRQRDAPRRAEALLAAQAAAADRAAAAAEKAASAAEAAAVEARKANNRADTANTIAKAAVVAAIAAIGMSILGLAVGQGP